MPAIDQPFVVASDAHLTPSSPAVAADLARLIARHPGHEIVLGGDMFSLSSDPPGRDPAESVRSTLSAEPSLPAALRAHLAAGGRVVFVAGNHDASIVSPGVRRAMLGVLELDDAAPLAIEPWFLRRGSVHVEHGHAYDPDNAPAHPLGLWGYRSEPLGISLTRRFLAKRNAFAFAHAHETTPVEGLKRAFQEFGSGTPLLIGQYFASAAGICLEAAFERRFAREHEHGELMLPEFSERSGVGEHALRRLLAERPAPTHSSFQRTFMRLYFDRVLATVGIPAGLLARLLVRSNAAAALSLMCAAYLYRSVREGVNRYSNLPVQRLYEGAELVRAVTGAETVIFGHTHCEDETDGYVNSASFAYTERAARPYLRVGEDGRVERRFLEPA
jgi:UDP-2,3-diacylglucosamine pyrophosphatase LpxH